MFRSREIKLYALLLLVIGAASTMACFAISTAAGIVAGAASLLFILSLLFFTRWRYRQLARLASYLKRINSGDYALDVRDNTEGELSILKSEIYKTTVMLRERSALLLRDKAVLETALSDISHQLKTPLTSMLMMTDLLCDNNLPEHQRRAFTGRIRSQLERIQWLVSALLKLSRLDAKAVDFKQAHISVNALIEKASAPLLILMELKNQSLVIKDGGMALSCDNNWTAEALLNILKNCVEHTPEGGEIMITCEANPLYTQLKITDSGSGIPKEDLPYIFKRFYRGKNAADDSIGIGLAMAAAIISEQGGTLDAQSTPGGSVFTIRFPK